MKTLLALTCAGLLCLGGCDDNRKPDTDAEIDPTSNTAAPSATSREGTASDDYEPITEFATFNTESFSELRQMAADQDKVLVVDFWATWCGSCVEMFPVLHKAMHQGDRDEKVMLVSVTQDDGDAFIAQALKFVNQHKAGKSAFHQPQDAVDPVAKTINQMMEQGTWAGSALPAVFVFDTDGELAYAMTQTSGDVNKWVAGIAEAADKAAE